MSFKCIREQDPLKQGLKRMPVEDSYEDRLYS